MNAPRALNCAHQCFVSTHVSLYFWSTAVNFYTFGVLLSTLQELAFRAGYYPALSVQLRWGEKQPARSASGNLECTCRMPNDCLTIVRRTVLVKLTRDPNNSRYTLRDQREFF